MSVGLSVRYHFVFYCFFCTFQAEKLINLHYCSCPTARDSSACLYMLIRQFGRIRFIVLFHSSSLFPPPHSSYPSSFTLIHTLENMLLASTHARTRTRAKAVKCSLQTKNSLQKSVFSIPATRPRTKATSARETNVRVRNMRTCPRNIHFK